MISFNYECDFKVSNESEISEWISSVIASEERKEGDINYIFSEDAYLHILNVKFLNHDTLTDIISFDYTVGKKLQGDIFISVERVVENAKEYEVSLEKELKRVMVHGVLHLCGYNDKSESDKKMMRERENFYLNQFNDN